jgi:Universal stress protein family
MRGEWHTLVRPRNLGTQVLAPQTAGSSREHLLPAHTFRYKMIRHGRARSSAGHAKELNAELIVLGVRSPSGSPGAATHPPIATSHKVVSHARCPVLTVRG